MDQLIAALIDLALPALVAGIIWALAKVASYFKAKTNIEYVQGAIGRLNEAVVMAVREVEQTVKAELVKAKSDGKITAAEAKGIKAAAIAAAKSYLGAKGIAEIIKVLGIDASLIDKLVGGKIEQVLSEMKDEKAGAAIPK
jgi:predicted Zn-dependent protease